MFKSRNEKLINASRDGNLNKVRRLVQNGASVDAQDNDGGTPLHAASFQGHKDVVEFLLERGANIDVKGCAYGWTPLQLASANGKEAVVEFLLENGADKFVKTKCENTLLHIACANGHEAVVRVLLQKGIDPNIAGEKGDTPLQVAQASDHQNCVEAIQSFLQQRQQQLDKELLDASGKGDLERVQRLLENDADIEAKDDDGRTPLQVACGNGHDATAELLLDNLANIDATDNSGLTALHVASGRGHEAVVELLLDHCADENARDNSGSTPLHHGSINGKEAVVNILLFEFDADENAKDSRENVPLHFASSNGDEAIVKLLLKKGADIQAQDTYGSTPLHKASSSGKEAVVKLLLENGADPDIVNKNGKTPLKLAQENNKQTCAEAIQFHKLVERIRREEDEEEEDTTTNDWWVSQLSDQDQALLDACEDGIMRDVRQLLQNGANANVKDDPEGNTPLHLASLRGHEFIVKCLLENGAKDSIEAENNDGTTPLRLAMSGDISEAVFRLLLENGANVEAKDSNGDTPLHDASRWGHEAFVQLLLQRGADPNIENKKGKTPLQLAQEWNCQGCVDVIQSFPQRQREKEQETFRSECLQKFPTRTELDQELQRLQEVMEMGKNSVESSVSTAAEDAKKQRDALVLVCDWPEYMEMSKLDEMIRQKEAAVRGMVEGSTEKGIMTQELYELWKQRLERSDQDGGDHNANAKLTQNHDHIREQLRLAMERKRRDPVEVTSSYINDIDTGELLGKGFYGVVYKGFDRVLGKAVALKKVDTEVFDSASPTRIAGIHNSFQNEMNILSKLDHPNIASLYGFYFDLNDVSQMALIYELASNGSLDGFWEDDDQRQRLSSGLTRIKIAYQVAMVLRYMHEGLDGQAVCFHCDIKSANVCLASDFTVRIIDCGLSKYIEEIDRRLPSTKLAGTVGYIAPDYSDGSIRYDSSCDVFSFGVFLCELITGTTSPSGKSGHYIAFEKKKMKALDDCVDPCVDWDGSSRERLVELALKCIKPSREDRPTIGDVVETLYQSLNTGPSTQAESVGARRSFPLGPKCRICGRDEARTLSCFGSTPHAHCGECIEDSLIESMSQGEAPRFCCLKEDCNSRDFRLSEIKPHVSRVVLLACSFHSNLRAAKSEMIRVVQTASDKTTEKVGEGISDMLRQQAQLCAGNGLPCPRRFVLFEANPDGSIRPWRHPREWFRNAKSIKLYLYFVCSHSNKLVSDKNRIKLRYTKKQLLKIAPAYNASLFLLQLATPLLHMAPDAPPISSSANKVLDALKLSEMEEWSRDLLEPNDKVVLAGARENGNVIRNGDVQELIGPGLSLIAEKVAEKGNLGWLDELTAAYDFQEKEATFINPKYLSEERYKKWQPS